MHGGKQRSAAYVRRVTTIDDDIACFWLLVGGTDPHIAPTMLRQMVLQRAVPHARERIEHGKHHKRHRKDPCPQRMWFSTDD